MTEYKKKLIEVALPLETINREAAHEKSVPRRGHPATLHLWWARRPLAVCRAVLFASLVDDPSAHPDKFPSEEAQTAERRRLFDLMEHLVKWENSRDEQLLSAARRAITESCGGSPPPVVDPFCGGGSIPVEAQRLGLQAYGSDLNPVACLITRALIEMPAAVSDLPPVNPAQTQTLGDAGWSGATGLSQDIRYYGHWLRDRASERLTALYPDVSLPPSAGGGRARAIAWIWARTVRCGNPACGAQMPLVRSFSLSSKKGKEAWIEPVVDGAAKSVSFKVRTGSGLAPEGTTDRNGVRCLVCGSHQSLEYVREEGKRGGLGAKLLAIVAEGRRSRIYCPPDEGHETIALSAVSESGPTEPLADNPRYMSPPLYGLTTHASLFSSRQLAALTTLSDLLGDVRHRVIADAQSSPSFSCGDTRTSDGASPRPSPQEYADYVVTYLAFAIDKLADWSSTVCSWIHSIQGVRDTFARQAIPMAWDYVEINPFSDSVGNIMNHCEWVADAVEGAACGLPGRVAQLDATATMPESPVGLVSTDPPYYDNIGYADLSDFFYVWLRRSLKDTYPELFSTLLTPKKQELVASPYRFAGGRAEAQRFFETGLGLAFERIRQHSHPDYPIAVYYAFKQAEASSDGSGAVASTGWETMLSGLLASGLAVTGTWPMRSERAGRTVAVGTNALASSVVLVCRPRSTSAVLASRKEFLAALRDEMPDALRTLQQQNIAPVDLAQASIGPGMGVFSRYSRVVEADGSGMSVRTALALINQVLDEMLAEQEGEFDADTRWAVAWYSETGVEAGDFGRAELLSKAKVTSVQGMVEAGILEARAGKVRLLRREELDEAWDPSTDTRLTVWEMTQHLIRRLDEGESAAAALARQLGANAEVARDLAYRLYLICERKKWTQEAQAYNALVVAWPQIQLLAASEPAPSGPTQTDLGI